MLFSGLTVVLALAGLLLVPTNIFASLAIGAILVVSMAVLAALTLLPAVLSLLGDRVNSLKIPYLGRRLLKSPASGRTSWLARMAQGAMRRPALALSAGVVILLLAASPIVFMKTGVSGVSTFPDSFESKRAFGILEQAVLGGEREPRAGRRGRPGELAGRPGRHIAPRERAGRPTRRSGRCRCRRPNRARWRCCPCP